MPDNNFGAGSTTVHNAAVVVVPATADDDGAVVAADDDDELVFQQAKIGRALPISLNNLECFTLFM